MCNTVFSLLHYPQENRPEPFHKNHSPLASQMEHIDPKKDRIITHRSFDPLFFHFFPNKTLVQNNMFKGTTFNGTSATWLPFLSHPLFWMFSWQKLFHYFAIKTEANPSALKGSGVATVYLDVHVEFHLISLNYFQLTWIHHIVHKRIQLWWEDVKT